MICIYSIQEINLNIKLIFIYLVFLDTVNLFGTSNTCTMMSNSAKKNGRKVAYNDTCNNKLIHIRKIA